jgi:hypothetical protein
MTPVSDVLGPNQACTLFGSTTGQTDISGKSYVAAGFSLQTTDIWRRNLLVLIGFFLLFQLTQVLAIEYFSVYTHLSLLHLCHLTQHVATCGRCLCGHLCQRECRNQETQCCSYGEEDSPP